MRVPGLDLQLEFFFYWDRGRSPPGGYVNWRCDSEGDLDTVDAEQVYLTRLRVGRERRLARRSHFGSCVFTANTVAMVKRHSVIAGEC